jgi:poly-beta-1,6-N-acetyl-D-glucosamine synthase
MRQLGLTYAVVTPCRDEELNLSRLAASLTGQRQLPARWVIVDNGSVDGTLQLAEELAARHDWVRVLQVPGTASPRPGGPIVAAFNAGLAALERERLRPDVIVKLDADVSMGADYFLDQMRVFEADPLLGIASGSCLEYERGAWRPTPVSGGNARGAARAYRAVCLQQVRPLVEGMGWDGVDAIKANTLGWRTGVTPGLAFRHHRALGARDGHRLARWRAQGQGSHYMGYRWWFVVARSLRHAPHDLAAVGMIWGFAEASFQRAPVHPDPVVVVEVRRRQSPAAALQRLRRLMFRARRSDVGPESAI